MKELFVRTVGLGLILLQPAGFLFGDDEEAVVETPVATATPAPAADPEADLVFLDLDGTTEVELSENLYLNTDAWILGSGATASESQTFMITVFNRGEGEATDILMELTEGGVFSFSGGTFPGTLGTCTAETSLAEGESCTIELQVDLAASVFELPLELVALSSNVAFSYDGAGAGSVEATPSLYFVLGVCTTPQDAISVTDGASAFAMESDNGVMGQSFVTVESGYYSSLALEVRLISDATLDSVMIKVFEDCEGLPCETAVESSTIESAGIPTDALTEVNFTFEHPVFLTSGETYWFVVEPINYSSPTGYLAIAGTFTENTYADGQVIIGSNTYQSWNTSWVNYDMNFTLSKCAAAAR